MDTCIGFQRLKVLAGSRGPVKHMGEGAFNYLIFKRGIRAPSRLHCGHAH